MFCKYFKGTVVNPKLPWVRPHPVYDGVEQRFVPAELWWENSTGITPVLVGRRDWRKRSGSILHFESTWDDQAVFFGSLGKEALSNWRHLQDLCVLTKFGDQRESWAWPSEPPLTSGSFRNGSCWLSVSQQRRRQFMSFAGSSPKHCEFLFCNSISSQIQSV